LEPVYRSLYFRVNAISRGETDNPVQYLVENAQLFGLIKRKRKPPTLTRLNLTLRGKPYLVTDGLKYNFSLIFYRCDSSELNSEMMEKSK